MRGRTDPTQEQHARWVEQRAQGRADVDNLLEGGPTDPLDRIAWLTGIAGRLNGNDLTEATDAALNQRAVWREIAAALGLGDDDRAVAQAQSRHRRRKGGGSPNPE